MGNLVNKAEIVKHSGNPIVGPGRYKHKSFFENKISGTTMFQKENKTTATGTNRSMSPRRLNCTCVPGPPGWSNNTGPQCEGFPSKTDHQTEDKKKANFSPKNF